jgi:hypothetical protein
MILPNFYNFAPYIKGLPTWHVQMSADPLVGAMIPGPPPSELLWFKTFVWVEL